MPKIKTLKAAAKRFKKTGSGRFKRHRSHDTHLKTKKSGNRKRKLRQGALVSKSDESRVTRMLPYG